MKKTQNILFRSTLFLFLILSIVLQQFCAHALAYDKNLKVIAEGSSVRYYVISEIDDINALQKNNFYAASPYGSEENEEQEEKQTKDNHESNLDFVIDYFFCNAITLRNNSQLFSFNAELSARPLIPLYILFHSWKHFLC